MVDGVQKEHTAAHCSQTESLHLSTINKNCSDCEFPLLRSISSKKCYLNVAFLVGTKWKPDGRLMTRTIISVLSNTTSCFKIHKWITVYLTNARNITSQKLSLKIKQVHTNSLGFKDLMMNTSIGRCQMTFDLHQ